MSSSLFLSLVVAWSLFSKPSANNIGDTLERVLLESVVTRTSRVSVVACFFCRRWERNGRYQASDCQLSSLSCLVEWWQLQAFNTFNGMKAGRDETSWVAKRYEYGSPVWMNLHLYVMRVWFCLFVMQFYRDRWPSEIQCCIQKEPVWLFAILSSEHPRSANQVRGFAYVQASLILHEYQYRGKRL